MPNHPLIEQIFLNEASPQIALGAIEQGMVVDPNEEYIKQGGGGGPKRLLDGFLWNTINILPSHSMDVDTACKVVDQLLVMGADPAWVFDPGSDTGRSMSALGFAATRGPILIFKTILNSMGKAEVQEFFSSQGPQRHGRESVTLPWAHSIMHGGDLERITLLKDAGFDLETPDHKGRTLLFFAGRSAPDVIRLGADPGAEDDEGLDAVGFVTQAQRDGYSADGLRDEIVKAVRECAPEVASNAERIRYIHNITSPQTLRRLEQPYSARTGLIMKRQEYSDTVAALLDPESISDDSAPIHEWEVVLPRVGKVDGLSAVAFSMLAQQTPANLLPGFLDTRHFPAAFPEPAGGSADAGALLYIAAATTVNHYRYHGAPDEVVKFAAMDWDVLNAFRKELCTRMGVERGDDAFMARLSKATEWVLTHSRSANAEQGLSTFWEELTIGRDKLGQKSAGLLDGAGMAKNLEKVAHAVLSIGKVTKLFGDGVVTRLSAAAHSTLNDPKLAGLIAILLANTRGGDPAKVLKMLPVIALPEGMGPRYEKAVVKRLASINPAIAQNALLRAKVKAPQEGAAPKKRM